MHWLRQATGCRHTLRRTRECVCGDWLASYPALQDVIWRTAQ